MLVCIYKYYVLMHLLYTYISVMNASMHKRVCVFMHLLYAYGSVMNANMYVRVLCIYSFTVHACIRYEC
jgi:hypothetical protein